MTLGLLLNATISAAAAQAGNAAFAAAWQRYVEQAVETPRQDDCVPRLYVATPDRERQGAVIMYHGFSGCPQQLFELAERVAAQGYDVLLPLLPGHGADPLSDGDDDLTQLPNHKTWPRYTELAARMNDIMAKSPGTRVAVGFSLGGAMALNATLRTPDRYDRLLLLAPMLAIRGGGFVEGAAGLLGRLPGARGIVVKPRKFREECDQWQAAGRDGFCDYRYENAAALVEVAQRNRALLDETRLTLPIQIVGAGDENYVSNPELLQIAASQAENGPIELCFLPEDVPHEMLTPYENADREMYWLEGLLRVLVGFVVDGEFVPERQYRGADQNASPACVIAKD